MSASPPPSPCSLSILLGHHEGNRRAPTHAAYAGLHKTKPSHHRLKTLKPWVKIKPSLLSNWSSQVLCHSQGKLSLTAVARFFKSGFTVYQVTKCYKVIQAHIKVLSWLNCAKKWVGKNAGRRDLCLSMTSFRNNEVWRMCSRDCGVSPMPPSCLFCTELQQ